MSDIKVEPYLPPMYTDFKAYQRWTKSTAIYDNPIIYPALELAGEAGEVCNQVKKIYRDDKGYVSPTRKTDLEKEIGDVLWALARLVDDLGLDFNKVAEYNVKKLEDRKARNVIGGSGDNR
tara:strand:+ start:22200 stop:22562 length:363 start_codon:yes stop_codon:yes gene_type:complete